MFLRSLLYSHARVVTYYFLCSFIFIILAVAVQQTWLNLLESGVLSRSMTEEVATTLENHEPESKLADPRSVAPRLITSLKVLKGDTLAGILAKAGVSKNETHKIISTLSLVFKPKHLKIGNEIGFTYSDTTKVNNKPKLMKILVNAGSTKRYEVKRKANNRFIVKEIIIPVSRYVKRVSGDIKTSFIETASKLGVPYKSIMNMVKAYSYDVDFQRDIKLGCKLDVMLEKFYTKEGNFSHNGDVVYASLSLKTRGVEIYLFTDKYGEQSYFNGKALSVRKQLLRTPVNASRISSGFGMRKHPILGYSRMHKGVDFAAPMGAPILASGSGIIREIGRKGSYGKYIRIQHNSTYGSAYAHIKRYAKGLKRGSKVRQGQVIGYVGMTGITSGPHLHYEVIKNGKQINPQKMRLSPGIRLTGKELFKFKKTKSDIQKLLSKLEPFGKMKG